MGAGASVDVVTKEQCQSLYGDLFDEGEWNKAAVDGVVTRDKLHAVFLELTDVFLTHDWGMDGTTHKNVSAVNTLLKARGITTWFDEEKMEGNVKKQMIHGIDHARAIVVFVTQRYIDKVGGNNAEDNCQLEFNYAARRKTASKMIPVLIDPSPALKNTGNWTGEVGFVLGGHLYLDLSSAFGNDQLLASKVDELVAKIVSVAGAPLAERIQSVAQHDVMAAPPLGVATTGAGDPSPRASTISTVALATLTHHQVGALLNNLTCSKYSAAFVENEITGEVLCGVASADEVKEMGVALAPKARMLFDKITEFKASGVPSQLLQAKEATPTNAVSPRTLTTTQETFEEIKAALLPPTWAQLYKYQLETSGANQLSNHKLTWPTPACSMSVLGGLFSNGDYADLMKNNWEVHRLEPLASRLDKREFLLSFKMKVVRGDATPICAGYNPWFAIDISSDMCLIIQCNREVDSFVVQLHGHPWQVPKETWLDVAVLVDVPHALIQVVVNTERMDPISLPPQFDFTADSPTHGNEFSLTRLDTMTNLFHGNLRKIELYSTVPCMRPQPVVGHPDGFPDCRATHLGMVHGCVVEWKMNALCDYRDMKTSVVDSVEGKEMAVPKGSFIHPELGTYFDGDYYSEAFHQANLTRAGNCFNRRLNNYAFLVTMRFASMGPCYLMTLGISHRYFVVKITEDGSLVVLLNCHSEMHTIQDGGGDVKLPHKTWHDLAVGVYDNAIVVVADGRAMDRIVLSGDFKFSPLPGEDTELLLVNYGCGGCFHGFLESLALWSTGCPEEG
ncbi:hypothetical protein H310_06235 [Aphanomyces invadans]|uniref:TIR domain-containing protein n=1 Tax=Aphanomyces invadans TaxID=157072 RepID=A0A024U5U5_9STRA|nr:hypothetical protein H310_06235 [Aphanomyces invadans]ETW01595.1 hypothetical protein H310_06235 [Aphanomyces invadans]|eukprot:XP_008869443.1 hypothetical protein H310_06235 [Aphanomyces invadans]